MDPPQSKVRDVGVRRKLMNAIGKLQGKKGISLKDLKKYLKDKKKMDVSTLDSSIKLALKTAMAEGILTREDGNYKLKEARKRPIRSRSKGKKSSGSRKKRRSSGPKKGRPRRRKSGSGIRVETSPREDGSLSTIVTNDEEREGRVAPGHIEAIDVNGSHSAAQSDRSVDHDNHSAAQDSISDESNSHSVDHAGQNNEVPQPSPKNVRRSSGKRRSGRRRKTPTAEEV